MTPFACLRGRSVAPNSLATSVRWLSRWVLAYLFSRCADATKPRFTGDAERAATELRDIMAARRERQERQSAYMGLGVLASFKARRARSTTRSPRSRRVSR